MVGFAVPRLRKAQMDRCYRSFICLEVKDALQSIVRLFEIVEIVTKNEGIRELPADGSRPYWKRVSDMCCLALTSTSSSLQVGYGRAHICMCYESKDATHVWAVASQAILAYAIPGIPSIAWLSIYICLKLVG